MIDDAPPAPRPSRAASAIAVRWTLRAFGIACIALDAWTFRHRMNPDGDAYLDLARLWAAGDWRHALNAYWSPLYSWLLAIVVRPAAPSPAGLVVAAHVLNALLAVLALAAFEWLHHEWRAADVGRRSLHSPEPASVSPVDVRDLMPDARWTHALGFAITLWCIVVLTPLRLVTPDIGTTALVIASGALLLHIRRTGGSIGQGIALGALLVAGYWEKAAMFPIAFAFIASAALASGSVRRAARTSGAALASFALLAAPLAIALSLQKGRPTFGDSGALNYAWFVNGSAAFSDWPRRPPPFGRPLHPARLVSDAPAVYAFAAPVRGTYPIWVDPSWWYDGIRPRFDARQQLAQTTSLVRQYVARLWLLLLVPAIVWTIARLRGRGTPLVAEEPSPRADGRWPMAILLLAPSLAALALYALVYFEWRHVSGFVALLLLGAWASLGARRWRASGAWGAALAGATALALLVAVGQAALATPLAQWRGEHPDAIALDDPAVAASLDSLGVRAGAPVATIGDADEDYWAFLGGYRVIAEIPHRADTLFWSMPDDAARARALAALRRVGAVVAVGTPPEWADTPAWIPLGGAGNVRPRRTRHAAPSPGLGARGPGPGVRAGCGKSRAIGDGVNPVPNHQTSAGQSPSGTAP